MKDDRRWKEKYLGLLFPLCCLLLSGCSPATARALTIYASLPLHGPTAHHAQDILDGFQEQLAESHHAACEGRYALRLVALDNTTDGELDATLEAAAANKAALDPTAIAFLASFDPLALRVSLPILADADSLLVAAPMNPSPDLILQVAEPDQLARIYPAGPPALIRLGPTSDEQGGAAARWAHRVGVRTVYVLYDRYDPAGQAASAARGFRQTAQAIGLRVIGSFGLDRFAAEYDSVMHRVLEETRRAGGDLPALVFYAGPPNDHLARLFKAKRRWLGGSDSTLILSLPGFQASDFIRRAGDEAEEMLVLAPMEAAYGYDTAHLILAAINTACDSRGIDRRSVSRAAMARRSFSGRAGAWSAERDDGEYRLGEFALALYRVENGALTLLEAVPDER